MTSMVYLVLGTDNWEAFVDEVFTSKEMAQSHADKKNEFNPIEDNYYHYIVVEKKLRTLPPHLEVEKET